MKLKATYHLDHNGWTFTITNGKTRTISTGYRTKKAAQETVRDIIQGVRNNNKPNTNQNGNETGN